LGGEAGEVDETVEVEGQSSEAGEVSDAGAGKVAQGMKDGDKEAGSTPEGGDAGAATGKSFAGHYVGSDTTVRQIEGIPVSEEEDPNAKLSVEQDGRELVIEIINSLNDEPLCELKATVKEGRANEAELTPDQECFGDPSGVLEVTIESGSVSVKGEELVSAIAPSSSLSPASGHARSSPPRKR
jgi:hypothetical protein